MEKFHHFLYGTHFILEMDQKTTRSNPFKELEPGNTMITENRIQTFLYHFTVHHIPGPTNQLADCLLRLGNQKDNIKLPKLHV